MNAFGAEERDIVPDGGGIVFPAGARELSSNERLHAEADAIDAGPLPGADAIGGKRSGGRFDCGFLPIRRKYGPELVDGYWIEGARGSAAYIQGVGRQDRF